MYSGNFCMTVLVAQAIICLFGSLAFFAFWVEREPVAKGSGIGPRRRDNGLFWLGAAYAAWGIYPIWKLWGIWPYGSVSTGDSVLTFMSTLNSACLLLAAVHFEYGPEPLEFLRDRKRWHILTLGIAIAVAYFTTSFHLSHFDFGFSILALAILYYSLLRSFFYRREHGLFGLTILSLLLMFAVQILAILAEFEKSKISEISDFLINLLLVPAKTTLVILLFSLTTSYWKAKYQRPPQSDMSIVITGKNDGTKWKVLFSCAGEFENREIWFTGTPFHDLLLLACYRKNPATADSFLKIADLGLNCLSIKRVRDLFGDKRLFVIENDNEGGYILAIPPENIRLEEAELKKDKEWNEILKKFYHPN